MQGVIFIVKNSVNIMFLNLRLRIGVRIDNDSEIWVSKKPNMIVIQELLKKKVRFN